MLYGSKYPVGLGFATVLADMDFETYSEAGFIWVEELQKYVAPKYANKKGIFAVGATVYTEHPSAEVLSLSYDLKDGAGPRLWLPGLPKPYDLFEHIAAGKLIAAWNCFFEYLVWKNICVPKYGWPELPHYLLRDDAAKSRAYAWPGALAKAGPVSGAVIVKDKEGKRLLDKFSIPRNPTKKNPARRVYPADDLADAQKLYDYNITDIKTEADISLRCPDLNPQETEFWLCTQAMNARGVSLDMETIKAAIIILEQALDKFDTELYQLTDGYVQKTSELEKLKEWLFTRFGMMVKSLDKTTLPELIKDPATPPEAKRALELRKLAGSAGIKKLYAMDRMAGRGGRAYDLFVYNGARTGRDTGQDLQPQNIVKDGVTLHGCHICGRHFGSHLTTCPWCRSHETTSDEKPRGWSWEAVEDVVSIVRTKQLSLLEYYFGDPLLALSGVMRGLFVAGPGRDLICSDYSSIEAVVTAVLAGEQWRIKAFRNNEDIYYLGASGVTGMSYQEYQEYEKTNGTKHPDRQKIGKPLELGCFTPETQVLTNNGYKAMVDVKKTDKLWDGIAWVKHKGVICQGKKQTIKLDGVGVTPDHQISLNGSWRGAGQLVSKENLLIQALAHGSENLPLSARAYQYRLKNTGLSRFNATVGPIPIRSASVIYLKEKVHGVINVLKKPVVRTVKNILNTLNICRTTLIEQGYLTGCHPPSDVVTMLKRGSTLLMERAEFPSMQTGEKTERFFYNTFKLLKGGTTQTFRWIGLIITETMNLGISVLSRVKKTTKIKEPLRNYKTGLTFLKTVYDIAHAGPRNRFTIKTDNGHLIVHNCGFGGWIGAYRQFDKTDNFNDYEVKQLIIKWRAASPNIVEFWGGQVRGKPWAPERYELFGLEGMAIAAIKEPGRVFTVGLISFVVKDDILFCRLPSGRFLVYHQPRLAPSDRWEGQLKLSFMGWNSNQKMGPLGWVRIETYGGRLCENCISENTQVLTDSGWKPIESITNSDKVHDGVDFVPHGGLLYKGVQTCTAIDGVLMTLDHEVLTNEGWKTASQNPRPYRPTIRGAHCFKSGIERREKKEMGLSLRLWHNLRKSRIGRNQGHKKRPLPKLRLFNQKNTIKQKVYPRNVKTPGVSRLAVYEIPLSSKKSSRVQKLWRSRYRSLQKLAGFFPKFLDRYGRNISNRFTIGSYKQRSGLRARKLSVGYAENKHEQQVYKRTNKYPERQTNRSGSSSGIRYRSYNFALSFTEQMARKQNVYKTEFQESRVFDIKNAGPRQRFVIMGLKGPFIVHNCVQATARDIMAHAVPIAEKAGYPIVLRVHDELVAEVPEGFGSIEQFEKIMGTLPAWAAGWPIKASGGWRGKRYRKD